MISSRLQAPKYGPGYLLADGGLRGLHRKAKISVRPTDRQAASLHALLAACCEVYNAALMERREAWRLSKTTIRLFDQFNQVTHLRGVRDDVLAWGTQPVRSTLRRLDATYEQHLVRRARGDPSGLPGYRSITRFHTASWDEPIGWKVDAGAGLLRVMGVGTIKLSNASQRQIGRLVDRGGVPTTLSVSRRQAGGQWSWRVCVGFKDVQPVTSDPAEGANSIVGADRGVAVTLALSDGQLLVMPGFIAEARSEISELLRQREGKQKGSRSWRQLNQRIRRLYREAAQRSDNWARQAAHDLVQRYGVVVLEDLTLDNMVRSASGTLDRPGQNVKAKTGLNRSLHGAALGRLRHWICAKAEEHGRRTWAVEPFNTSRRCAQCGYSARENRPSQHRFRCGACGTEMHADTNAAKNIAILGLTCEEAWRLDGSPMLAPQPPRLRRRSDLGPGRLQGIA